MISVLGRKPVWKTESNSFEDRFALSGLSGDTKPTNEYDGGVIANASSFVEIDTGNRNLYDKENSKWYKVGSGGGSSDDRPATDEEIDETIDNLDPL